ncbi:MAG: SAM-dependent methyltransferase, partial [Leptospiraceae bacterium]|nr:SAM-dependent methyltransferase [Leptospiraceae bacterium]
MTGSVVIAGAGPGGLQHLTLGALEAIREAEVILYDALISDEIVAQFPEQAEKIFVGKRCGQHAWTQTMIISAMIAHALAGKKVLRLKGGDPAVFAHLAEELAALHKLAIPVRVVPGVTAVLAAVAELSRPLTARGGSRHVWITDGHSGD